VRYDLDRRPADDCLGRGDLINIAPLQLSEKVLLIHSAPLDEMLVMAPILAGHA
jgi:hypothetical protein